MIHKYAVYTRLTSEKKFTLAESEEIGKIFQANGHGKKLGSQ